MSLQPEEQSDEKWVLHGVLGDAQLQRYSAAGQDPNTGFMRQATDSPPDIQLGSRGIAPGYIVANGNKNSSQTHWTLGYQEVL